MGIMTVHPTPALLLFHKTSVDKIRLAPPKQSSQVPRRHKIDDWLPNTRAERSLKA